MTTFGVPITDETLQQMSQYRDRDRPVRQDDRAREAMRLIHAEGKNLSALQHVVDLKKAYGAGVAALVLVYNATGSRLDLVSSQDWSGYVYHEQPPSSFENGQWIAFLHGHPNAQAVGSEAARVYQGTNSADQVCDFLVSWSINWGGAQNSAYTEVRAQRNYARDWEYAKVFLEDAGKNTRDTDRFSTTTISVGGYTTSEVVAVLSSNFRPLADPYLIKALL